ncbi:FixH family protein [Nocardia transvalensis]|uniref:FixH family protein n=1 Tax=Nocardia transvalensis TaxID=37333 RepID=UPI0018930728|nr:FixH family protein [Nocardia transvalensis]MBF6327620.1 FixH family protein [Nocardia transvalensis]
MTTTAPAPESVGSRRRFRSLALAVLITVAIVALLVWLLWPSPPGPLVLRSGTPRHLVTLAIAHPRLGDSDVDIEVSDRSGNPVDAMVHLEAIEPRMGHAAPLVMATPTGPGHFRAAAVPFMTTGPWELRLSLHTTDGEDRITLPLWISG